MKIHRNTPIKASEIRYTRPDGRESVVFTDRGDEYSYIIREIEDVMGYEFASGVQAVFEKYEYYLNEYHNEVNESVDSFLGYMSDSIGELSDKLIGLRNYMKQPGAADDQTVNEYIDAAIDAVASVSADVDSIADDINAVNEDFGF